MVLKIDIKKLYSDFELITEYCVDKISGEINYLDSNLLLLLSLEGKDLHKITNLTDCEYNFDKKFLDNVNYDFLQKILHEQLKERSSNYRGFEALINKTNDVFEAAKAFDGNQVSS